MKVILKQIDGGGKRGVGYAAAGYSTNDNKEILIDASLGRLTEIFERAKQDGLTLSGAEGSIDEAVESPVDYLDYLTVDEQGSLVFNEEHTRPLKEW